MENDENDLKRSHLYLSSTNAHLLPTFGENSIRNKVQRATRAREGTQKQENELFLSLRPTYLGLKKIESRGTR